MSRRRASPPAAIESAEVVALNADGEGVVRASKTAFVAGALPGEQIRMQRRERHRQHDDAALIEVLSPSPDRVAPRCAHFGVCGGCALQHLDPSAQLAHKQRELEDALRRIGGTTPRRWLEPLSGPAWHYRRRARLGAKYVRKKGRTLVGFRERSGPYVAALERCEILVPPVDALIAPLAVLIDGLSIREQLPQIEVAVADRTLLVLRVLAPPSAADLERLLQFGRQHDVELLLQPGGHDSIVTLAGERPAPLRYALEGQGIELEFLPTDFVQVNAGINARLVSLALEQLELSADATVLDLFCGLGNFTLPIARHAARVTGVEGEAGLVERARANARRNGIDNAQFHVANLMGEDFVLASWARGQYSHVLLDPPRAGAREVLPLVASLAPRRIVYISCHPGSLARDVGLLVAEHGHVLEAAGVIDMFPHTAHVESIAVLRPA